MRLPCQMGDSIAAVLLVACSCSFALAMPNAMLASIGAGARRSMVMRGGKFLEALARVDVVLIDKTGTATLGKPQVTDVVDFSMQSGAAGRPDLLGLLKLAFTMVYNLAGLSLAAVGFLPPSLRRRLNACPI